MTGQERIAASRSRVWEALNDPNSLRQCIPGCQSLEKEAADKLRATVEIKIGPIGARFNSVVTLTDVQALTGYTLIGEGQGGTIGSAKTTIKVRLSDDGAGTLLGYEMEAEVSGRLAQLGGPIIDATAKQFATKFFKRFGEVVSGVKPETAAALTAASTGKVGEGAVATRGFPIAWILALIIAGLVGYLIGHATTPRVVLDKQMLEQLLQEQKRGAQ
jgi:carbon monoxide dehydrogenase subunit G